MNSFLFIIPRTPIQFRTELREKLWNLTVQSLLNQSYNNWKALIIDDFNLIDGKLIYINSPAIKKGEKLQAALRIIENWENKPDYIIRFDDDDIISPSILDFLKDKEFDVAADEYHTFYEIKSGYFCQSKRPWLANSVIHKYEHAKTILPDGRPLLDQDHSKEWRHYYQNKNILQLSQKTPVYCRIISPTSVTGKSDKNYLKYVLSFGLWGKNNYLIKYFGQTSFFNIVKKLFKLKVKINFAYYFPR